MWKRFYKQLVGMAQVLQDCPNGIVDVDAKDMYQSRIDMRQNTVVYF
ncbi:hypothetical protein WMO41_14965 [Ventrimonas sp. CLA-AP-H27]|uniref:Transposase n=1 Tax=Ventrimonas faecis TaxID=3133170 RepID=A0ABV1HQ38_9FIRM